MTADKIEPRLLQLLDEQPTRAAALGLSPSEVDQTPIDVTISHQEILRAPEARDEAERLSAAEDLSQRVRASQRPILDHLHRLGLTEQVSSLSLAAAGDHAAPRIPQNGVEVHSLVNAVTTQLTPAQIREISDMDEVRIIRLESRDPVTCMHESARMIEAFDARAEFVADGNGVLVAVLDSGIDKFHPAFNLANKVIAEVTTTPEPVNIPGNHGTHVAGTVASNDPIFRGIAPGANLANVKVLTSAGSGQPLWVINGLAQAVQLGARVVNLSLGWSEALHGWVCNDADCILCQAADNAVLLGVNVVVAAGNEDNLSANPQFAGTFNIRHPGTARRVITVGALDKSKALAPFSSIGPGSGRLSPGSPIRLTKPDVSAPGVGITSTVAGGGFAMFNGTSMASPHVAGLVALMLQKKPALRPMTVKKILEETCEPVPLTPNQAGYGLVNAYGALLRVS
jgi:serine protease AprX